MPAVEIFLDAVLATLAALLFLLLLGSLWWLFGQLRPYFHFGGPYVPTPQERVDEMVRLARLTGDDVVVDLGSGDGRFLFAALDAGAKKAIGYEIDPSLVAQSLRTGSEKGCGEALDVRCASMWQADLSDTSVVFLFQIPFALPKLAEKLRELPSGARIVAYGYTLPGWETEAAHPGGIYVYRRGG